MIWARAHWRRHIFRYLYIKFTQNLILQSLYRFIHQNLLLRASVSAAPYVPNAKYLAHLAHQTPFDPIYQMCHISYLLQHATIESQICHGMEPVWHMDLFFFIPLSLSSLSSSPSAIHHLHLHSLTYLFLLLLQLFTASITTLPYSFFFPFPFCSLYPLCFIFDTADSLLSFSPSR